MTNFRVWLVYLERCYQLSLAGERDISVFRNTKSVCETHPAACLTSIEVLQGVKTTGM